MENKPTGDIVEPCYQFFCKIAKKSETVQGRYKILNSVIVLLTAKMCDGRCFQMYPVGFQLPASAAGYSTMSPWAMDAGRCSTFCLPHRLCWSWVILIGLVISLYKYFLSLCCYSAVLWLKILMGFAWTPPAFCVLESLLILVSQGSNCLRTDTITAAYFGNKSLRRRL